MGPSFSIGPLNFHYYGLVIAASIYIGWLVAKKRAKLFKIPESLLDDPILFLPLLLGLIGARAYHVLDRWSFYSHNLKEIFYIANGGLGIFGGLVGIFLGIIIISKKRKIILTKILDLIAPSLLFAQALGRLGNFINQEGFGPPTKLPWGIYVNPQNRPEKFFNFSRFHPTFFYEAFLDLFFFGLLLLISKKIKLKSGQQFALYLIFFATGRFIAEFFRIDTWQISGIKVAHFLALLTFSCGAVMFIAFKNKGLDIA